MSDLTLRRLATRQRGSAAHLNARVRAGELTAEHVTLAASLGHAAARELDPVPLVDWANWDARRGAISAARDLLDETLPARVAADWADRVLPLWEAKHPDDDRPRKAIEAARAWAECPCDEHTKAAAAAYAAAYAAACAAYAAHGAAYAAHAAACAAYAARARATAARDAATAARDAADAEQEWQRLRLAAYVLGLSLASDIVPTDPNERGTE